MNPEPAQNQRWETLAKTANYKANELAVLCGVSLRTLQRHFSKNYQVKISEWLRAMRLRQAYSQLTSGLSVKEVAFDLGYKQLSHFSRDFKGYYGVTPSLLTPVRAQTRTASATTATEARHEAETVVTA